MENSDAFKKLSIHEFHSYIMRSYEVGIIDERMMKYKLDNVNTFTNNRDEIYIHASDIVNLEIHEQEFRNSN